MSDLRAWYGAYEEAALPTTLTLDHSDALSMFRTTVSRHRDRVAIRYFDGCITYGELDELSDALAVELLQRGFSEGDRLAIFLQNVPPFAVAILATWKAGGVVVPINPMNTGSELQSVLDDVSAEVILCDAGVGLDRVGEIESRTDLRLVLVTSEYEYQSRDDARVLPPRKAIPEDRESLVEILERRSGEHPPSYTPSPDSPAFITFTSGTTGRAKGAINTHANVAFSAQVYREWMGMTPEDCIFGLAPMSTIAGSIVGFAVSIHVGCTYDLTYRFHPAVAIDAIHEHRATFLLAPATAIIAMLDDPRADGDTLGSLKDFVVGGAPTPAVLVERWRRRVGNELKTGYGMTEVTGPTALALPDGKPVPVDAATGALAVGVPVFDTDVRVVDDDGNDLPTGEIGEIVVKGPQVVPGYWERPAETEGLFRDGWMLTGDLGKMDAQGWLYVIDRKKDLIISSGFNVIPAEVEEVIYRHPAVREAAVVGLPDPYRGEEVTAFVSLDDGACLTDAELKSHCRDALSAYKCPRRVVVLPDLPKSPNGKILRRRLKKEVASRGGGT